LRSEVLQRPLLLGSGVFGVKPEHQSDLRGLVLVRTEANAESCGPELSVELMHARDVIEAP
jgi:hypothetical protein